MPERAQLKEIVVEASRALARLDAVRLEELALACEALRREVNALPPGQWAALTNEARQAVQPMCNLARVLDATSANLGVLTNVTELRSERLEYGGRRLRT